MSFEELLKRILFRWWLILISTAVFTLAFFNWSNTSTYQASIGLGISFNSPEFLEAGSSGIKSNDPASADEVTLTRSIPEYTYSLQEFSKYLTARFSSIDVQSMIAQEAGLKIDSYDNKVPFYSVTNNSGGYVSLSFESSTEDSAKRFLDATKTVYKKIIEVERSNKELEPFQIESKDKFIESLVPVSKPAQFRVLPLVSGFLFGLALTIFIPIKKI